jgi:uracil phosphoribosyltransferase
MANLSKDDLQNLGRAPSKCVGPEYKDSKDKPTATVSTEIPHANVHILPQTPQLISLLTYVSSGPSKPNQLQSKIDWHVPLLRSIIRDKSTNRSDFIFYSNRIMRLLVEEGLNHLPVQQHMVTTPVGRTYNGVKFEGKICGVSIMRAGESMEQALRECCRSVRIGKILIQRDEETSKPRLFYDKLPEDIADRWVLLLDPMLATGKCGKRWCEMIEVWQPLGGSALMAVDVLLSRGVPEERILFLNLIASPEGAANFAKRFPKLRVVTAFVDEGLDEKKWVMMDVQTSCDAADQLDSYIVPGLGDFGDRFYTLWSNLSIA